MEKHPVDDGTLHNNDSWQDELPGISASSDPSTRYYYRFLVWLTVLGTLAVSVVWLVDPNRPFRTAQRFASLVKQHQYEDAMAMMSCEDREKIPASYWRQFDKYEFDVLSSPTLFSFVNHRFHILIFFKHSNGDSGIRFEVNGDTINVVDVNVAYLNSLSN